MSAIPPLPEQIVPNIMRTIDAYAIDYQRHGKFIAARRDVEREILDALRAAQSASAATTPDGLIAPRDVEDAALLIKSWAYAANAPAGWHIYGIGDVSAQRQALTDERIESMRSGLSRMALMFVSARAFRLIARYVERTHGIGPSAR